MSIDSNEPITLDQYLKQKGDFRKIKNLDEYSYLMAVGFKGHIYKMGVATLESYSHLNDLVKGGIVSGYAPFTPVAEFDMRIPPIAFSLPKGHTQKMLTSKVAEEYKKAIDEERYTACEFGDLMQVVHTGPDDYLLMLSNKAYHKPALAADIAIAVLGMDKNRYKKHFVEDARCAYLVTGIRKNNPGKGKPSWFGGFKDVSADPNTGIYRFDSGIDTIIHEGLEEAGCKILSQYEGKRYGYDEESANVLVQVGSIEYKAKIMRVGEFNTGDSGLEEGGETYMSGPNKGMKRVYATEAYVLVLDLGNALIDEDVIAGMFKAGDDIRALNIVDVTSDVRSTANYHQGSVSLFESKLQFGIEHHNTVLPYVLDTVRDVLNSSQQVYSN